MAARDEVISAVYGLSFDILDLLEWKMLGIAIHYLMYYQIFLENPVLI